MPRSRRSFANCEGKPCQPEGGARAKGARLPRRTALAARVTAAVLTVAGAALIISCASAPPPPQASAQEIILLRAAEKQVDIGSPESLQRAAEKLKDPDLLKLPRSQELLGLTTALWRLLYPEWNPEVLESLPPGANPFPELFQRAERGLPPQTPMPKVKEPSFLSQVLPSLFLVKSLELSKPEAEVPPDLAGHLEALTDLGEAHRQSVLPPYLAAVAAEALREWERARGGYAEALARDRSCYPAALNLARLEMLRGRPEAAVPLLEGVLEIFPGHRDAHARLLEAYRLTGGSQQALTLVSQDLVRNPEDPELLLERARLLEETGDWVQALKPLNLLIARNPRLADAYLLKAQILDRGARDPEAALTLLESGEKTFPRDPRFPEAAGELLLRMQQGGEALTRLNRALELEPERPSTLRILLADAVSQKRWLQAAVFLGRILEREETPADLAVAYQVARKLKDPAQALGYAEKLYRMQGDPPSLSRYARALFENGRAPEALSLVEKGLAAPANTMEARVRSDLLLLKALLSEDPQNRLAGLQASLLAYPDNPETLSAIAEAYRQRGQGREAILYLKRAVALNPEDTGLRLQLQQLEAAQQ